MLSMLRQFLQQHGPQALFLQQLPEGILLRQL
jgi:hypothetical protein